MTREPYVITQFDLMNELRYNPESGIFVRLHDRQGVRKGMEAGSYRKDYVTVHVLGKSYPAHILAWLYMTGAFPDIEIDHRDGDGLNNKWDNLRLATSSQNSMNQKVRSDNTSGYKGVTWSKERSKWVSYVYLKGKLKFLGHFDDLEEAGAVSENARKKYFGEFNREA